MDCLMGSDTVTDHMDGTYTIDWCGGQIARIDKSALVDLYTTIGVYLDSDSDEAKETK